VEDFVLKGYKGITSVCGFELQPGVDHSLMCPALLTKQTLVAAKPPTQEK
jgi:hypothetical protein